MANVDIPGGLIPISSRLSAPDSGQINPYYLPTGETNDLFVHDAVIVAGSANAAEYEGFAPGTLPDIKKATAAGGAYITGSIVGFGPNRDNLSLQYRPGAAERLAWVADDPYQIFEIQEDNEGTALTVTEVSLNADLVFTHGGSTVTGISGMELDRSTIDVTATLQLRVIRLVNRIDNVLGDFARWEVMINLHTHRYTTGL